ncbi:MAG: RtcB family protein, partial [Alphaproteobacteria bacterium]
NSEIGTRYLGAMRSAINCALANREIIGHFTRQVFTRFFPESNLQLMFDVSHNTCKVETHAINGEQHKLFVHRKGATRAFGPGHPDLPKALQKAGQPVLIGGSMGTSSYILAGTAMSEEKAFSSACHGAGRAMSRHAALKKWSGRQVVDDLAAQGIIIRSPSQRGVAEEAPGAYKDVTAVVMAAEHAGLAKRVARLRPLVCIKG